VVEDCVIITLGGTKVKQHRGIWLPDSDTHFAGHLDAGPKIDGVGTYQHNKFEMAMKHVRNKRTCLDIGAHVGLWSRSLAREFQTVVAFEPVPEHIECFRRNLAGVTDRVTKKVYIYEYALGSADCKLHIGVTPENSGNAHILTGGAGIEVRVKRLDDHVFHDIDFIKIDVEGFELDVIKGGAATIKAHKPVMVVEQKKGHGQRYGVSDRAAVDQLLTWGYREVWCRNGDHCLVWKGT
jgi:FkbM family methyltransferase